MTAQQERMTNHWWWRPGWSVGRRFYTWHLTFEGQSDVHRFAEAYRQALAPTGGLDLIPDRWLHLTMQGINFIDEVQDDVVEKITKSAAQRLAALPAFEVTFNAPVIDPEAILVPVQPAEPVRELRDTIRAAMGDVLAEVPEKAEGFAPHVSIGYSNSEGPAAPYAEAIAGADIPPATALITHADLIVIHRDNRMYEWTTLAQVPLG